MGNSYYFVCFSRALLIFFASLTVSGCAITGDGPPFAFDQPDDGTAIIYHYRLSSFKGNGMEWDALSNGKPLTRMGNGGYFKQISEPGHITYRTKMRVHPFPFWILYLINEAISEYEDAYTLDVQAGKSYFLNWRVEFNEDVPHIMAIPEEKALKQIDGLLAFPADESP